MENKEHSVESYLERHPQLLLDRIKSGTFDTNKELSILSRLEKLEEKLSSIIAAIKQRGFK